MEEEEEEDRGALLSAAAKTLSRWPGTRVQPTHWLVLQDQSGI